MRRLRTRAIILVGTVALLPLLILGALSIDRARTTLLDGVVTARYETAERAAVEIDVHVRKYSEVLRRLSRVLAPANRLTQEQSERILKDYRIDVRDLRQLDFLDGTGREIATARADGRLRDRASETAVVRALAGDSFRSPVTVSESDLTPEIVVAEPQRSAGRIVGVLVATIDLTEMWRVVDQIKVGESGYPRVVGEDGRLIAVGTGKLKQGVFTGEKDRAGEFAEAVRRGGPQSRTWTDGDQRKVLGVGVPIGRLGWVLILEQPLAEALAPYYRFTTIILGLSLSLLALAALLGWYGARSVVRPIEVLRVRAGEIARGLLDARVEVRSPEELAALANAMNRMCEDLIRLQEDVRKKERIATLGRLAAGLAHDLKHPVRALQINARLVLERPDDALVRSNFGQVVQREFKKLEGFLDDLKRVSRDEPMNLLRSRLDAAQLLESFAREQAASAPAGVEIVVEIGGARGREAGAEELPIDGDRELLGRVLANLASNAYEAMEGEGRITLGCTRRGNQVELSVADTGGGISPERVEGLFVDFATTKKRGLGLGLAVCKKIVTDHGGAIEARSELGRGTEFVIRLPAAAKASSEAVAPAGDPRPPA